MSAICREDLLKDIEESVVCSGKVDHANAELRGVNKVIERIRIASAVYEKLGFIKLGTIPGGFHMKDGHYEDIVLFYHTL